MTLRYFPCGCTCSETSQQYAPHADRDVTPERLVEHLSIDDRQKFDEAMSQYYVDSARHEAGHVVAAVATGRGVAYATIGGGAPHVCYLPCETSPSILDLTITTSAGAVAERVADADIWSPMWSTLCGVIRKARDGKAGTCDACHVAKMLVAYFPDRPDEMLTETWFGVIAATHALVKDVEVHGAMVALANELHEKTLIEKPRIEAILSRYDLAGAMDRALSPLNLAELLPAWKLEIQTNDDDQPRDDAA